jgi:hypothetical protein
MMAGRAKGAAASPLITTRRDNFDIWSVSSRILDALALARRRRG